MWLRAQGELSTSRDLGIGIRGRGTLVGVTSPRSLDTLKAIVPVAHGIPFPPFNPPPAP